MNMFIKQQLVFGTKLGHRQAIIIQESEYMQKLKTNEQEIFPFTSQHIKNIYMKNAR
jgi:hypothetical protein